VLPRGACRGSVSLSAWGVSAAMVDQRLRSTFFPALSSRLIELAHRPGA